MVSQGGLKPGDVREHLSPERPVRLRRMAALIDERADETSDPASARHLACKMRLRAAAIEAGSEAEERLEQDTGELRQLGDELAK